MSATWKYKQTKHKAFVSAALKKDRPDVKATENTHF